jgi:hypothetical protein
MAVTINASTTSGLVMTSDLSGVLTLQQNGVSLPNGGVAPAFSAYQSSTQSVSANTFTKVNLQATQFDTNSNFSSSRFTPTVAGYYQINASVSTTTSLVSTTYFNSYIAKNGSTAYQTSGYPAPANYFSAFVGGLVYMNGSTDYIELYTQSNSAFTTQAGTSNTFLNGCLVRGA